MVFMSARCCKGGGYGFNVGRCLLNEHHNIAQIELNFFFRLQHAHAQPVPQCIIYAVKKIVITSPTWFSGDRRWTDDLAVVGSISCRQNCGT